MNRFPCEFHMKFPKFPVLLLSLKRCNSRMKKSYKKIKYTMIFYCSRNVHFWGYCCPVLPWGVSKNGIPEGHKPNFNRKGVYQEIMLIFCSIKIFDLGKQYISSVVFFYIFFSKVKILSGIQKSYLERPAMSASMLKMQILKFGKTYFALSRLGEPTLKTLLKHMGAIRSCNP